MSLSAAILTRRTAWRRKEKLSYSEGAAMRRMRAARALRDAPEIYAKLRAGTLTLCAISELAKVKDTAIRGLNPRHCYPFALGGETTVENLRLLCGAHNRLMAEHVFGAEKMQRFSRR